MGYDLSEYNPSEQGMYIFIPYDALEKERGQQLGIQKGIFFLMPGPRQNRWLWWNNGLMFQIWVQIVILLPTGHMTLNKVTKSKSQFPSDGRTKDLG